MISPDNWEKKVILEKFRSGAIKDPSRYGEETGIILEEASAALKGDQKIVKVCVSNDRDLIREDAWEMGAAGKKDGRYTIYVNEEFLKGLSFAAEEDREGLLRLLVRRIVHEYSASRGLGLPFGYPGQDDGGWEKLRQYSRDCAMIALLSRLSGEGNGMLMRGGSISTGDSPLYNALGRVLKENNSVDPETAVIMAASIARMGQEHIRMMRISGTIDERQEVILLSIKRFAEEEYANVPKTRKKNGQIFIKKLDKEKYEAAVDTFIEESGFYGCALPESLRKTADYYGTLGLEEKDRRKLLSKLIGPDLIQLLMRRYRLTDELLFWILNSYGDHFGFISNSWPSVRDAVMARGITFREAWWKVCHGKTLIESGTPARPARRVPFIMMLEESIPFVKLPKDFERSLDPAARKELFGKLLLMMEQDLRDACRSKDTEIYALFGNFLASRYPEMDADTLNFQRNGFTFNAWIKECAGRQREKKAPLGSVEKRLLLYRHVPDFTEEAGYARTREFLTRNPEERRQWKHERSNSNLKHTLDSLFTNKRPLELSRKLYYSTIEQLWRLYLTGVITNSEYELMKRNIEGSKYREVVVNGIPFEFGILFSGLTSEDRVALKGSGLKERIIYADRSTERQDTRYTFISKEAEAFLDRAENRCRRTLRMEAVINDPGLSFSVVRARLNYADEMARNVLAEALSRDGMPEAGAKEIASSIMHTGMGNLALLRAEGRLTSQHYEAIVAVRNEARRITAENSRGGRPQRLKGSEAEEETTDRLRGIGRDKGLFAPGLKEAFEDLAEPDTDTGGALPTPSDKDVAGKSRVDERKRLVRLHRLITPGVLSFLLSHYGINSDEFHQALYSYPEYPRVLNGALPAVNDLEQKTGARYNAWTLLSRHKMDPEAANRFYELNKEAEGQKGAKWWHDLIYNAAPSALPAGCAAAAGRMMRQPGKSTLDGSFAPEDIPEGCLAGMKVTRGDRSAVLGLKIGGRPQDMRGKSICGIPVNIADMGFDNNGNDHIVVNMYVESNDGYNVTCVLHNDTWLAPGSSVDKNIEYDIFRAAVKQLEARLNSALEGDDAPFADKIRKALPPPFRHVKTWLFVFTEPARDGADVLNDITLPSEISEKHGGMVRPVTACIRRVSVNRMGPDAAVSDLAGYFVEMKKDTGNDGVAGHVLIEDLFRPGVKAVPDEELARALARAREEYPEGMISFALKPDVSLAFDRMADSALQWIGPSSPKAGKAGFDGVSLDLSEWKGLAPEQIAAFARRVRAARPDAFIAVAFPSEFTENGIRLCTSAGVLVTRPVAYKADVIAGDSTILLDCRLPETTSIGAGDEESLRDWLERVSRSGVNAIAVPDELRWGTGKDGVRRFLSRGERSIDIWIGDIISRSIGGATVRSAGGFRYRSIREQGASLNIDAGKEWLPSECEVPGMPEKSFRAPGLYSLMQVYRHILAGGQDAGLILKAHASTGSLFDVFEKAAAENGGIPAEALQYVGVLKKKFQGSGSVEVRAACSLMLLDYVEGLCAARASARYKSLPGNEWKTLPEDTSRRKAVEDMLCAADMNGGLAASAPVDGGAFAAAEACANDTSSSCRGFVSRVLELYHARQSGSVSVEDIGIRAEILYSEYFNDNGLSIPVSGSSSANDRDAQAIRWAIGEMLLAADVLIGEPDAGQYLEKAAGKALKALGVEEILKAA